MEGGKRKLENKQGFILYSCSITLKSKTNIKYIKVSWVKNAKPLYSGMFITFYKIKENLKEKMMAINLNKI